VKRLLIVPTAVFTILVGTTGSASATLSPIEPRPGKYQACPEKVWTEVCPEVESGIRVGVSNVTASATTTTATVRWEVPAEYADIISGFWVEVGTGGSVEANPIMLQGKGSDVREATFTGLEPNTAYWISVEPVVPEVRSVEPVVPEPVEPVAPQPVYTPVKTEVALTTEALTTLPPLMLKRHTFTRRHIH